jgi:hypothetical protein
MKAPNKTKKAKKELRKMFLALLSDDWFKTYFKIGEFQCRNVLADGTIVSVNIKAPARPPIAAKATKKPAKTNHQSTSASN